MALDTEIKKILQSINTETRQAIQAVLEGEMSGPEIAAVIRQHAGEDLAPTATYVIQTCHKLYELGVLERRTADERGERKAKYYFSTKDKLYKIVATLALNAAGENNFSFSTVFDSFAGIDQRQSNNLLYIYKALLNFSDDETYNSISEKAGIPKSMAWKAVETLTDAGLLLIDEFEPEIKYFTRSFRNVKANKKTQKLAGLIEQYAPKNSPFTVNEMYLLLWPQGHSVDKIRYCVNALAKNKNLIKVDNRESAIHMTQLGRVVQNFIFMMDFGLRGLFKPGEIYSNTGGLNPENLKCALRAYRANKA